MKRSRLKSALKCLAAAAVYVFGLFIGILVITYVQVGGKKEEFFQKALYISERYAETGSLSYATNAGGLVLVILDASGVLQRQIVYNTNHVQQSFYLEAKENDYALVLKDGESFRFIPVVRDSEGAFSLTSLVYIGVAVKSKNIMTGVLVWVKELPDLLSILFSYAVIFTSFYFVGVFAVAVSSYYHKRYIRLQRFYTDSITHTLKSPVASIRALTEALSDDMEKDAYDRTVCYGMILSEANRLERLVHDILELSRQENKFGNYDRKTTPAQDCFSETFLKYSQICDLSEVSFEVLFNIASVPLLYTNAQLIKQVLEILLTNAIKFTKSGEKISVDVKVQRKKVTVCVKDTGAGIPSANLSHIFERFYMAKRDDNQQGNGLGLSIAKNIIDNLHEKIWICSEEGTGTSAFFTIKRSHAENYKSEPKIL